MSRGIKVKVRFNASKENFEKFGEGRYLAYLPFPQDDDSHNIIASLLSRKLGVPASRVEFAGVDIDGNWVFELL
jgi:hypothetical protein